MAGGAVDRRKHVKMCKIVVGSKGNVVGSKGNVIGSKGNVIGSSCGGGFFDFRPVPTRIISYLYIISPECGLRTLSARNKIGLTPPITKCYTLFLISIAKNRVPRKVKKS